METGRISTGTSALAGALPSVRDLVWKSNRAPSHRRGEVADRMSLAFGIDTRALGALRIGMALLLLVDLALRLPDLRVFYTDWGLLPRADLITHLLGEGAFISVYLMSGNAVVTACLFALAAFFALLLLAGHRARLATAASWFLLASLHTRNPMMLQGGDVLLRMLLFWGMFLPLDAAYVVGRRGTRATVVSAATAALLLQVGFVYFFGALLKSDPAWTVSHNAVRDALALQQFSTLFGRWLLRYPALLKMLTVSTLLLEFAGPWLAILPFRWPHRRTLVVLAFVGMHLAMAACLHLGLFPAICIVAWIPFLPGGVWDRASRLTAAARRRIEGAVERWPVVSRCFSIHAGAAQEHPPRLFAMRLRIERWVVLFFLAYVFCWNVRTVYAKADLIPAPLGWVAELFRLDQEWDMFAPAPLREDGWYVVQGQLADGSMVDVRHDRAPLDWSAPRDPAADYPGDRWRKYMVNLAAQQNTWYRAPYAEYLRRDWDERHPAGRRLVSVWIYYMLALNRPDGGRDAAKPVLLWHYEWKD